MGFSGFRRKSIGDHCILIPCNIRPARTTKIENEVDGNRGIGASKIPRDKTPDIFRERNTKFARSLTRAPLHLTLERDLGS